MKFTKYIFQIVLIFIILPLLSLKKLYAVVYFSDNFGSGNLNNWTQNVGNIGNTSSWYIQDNELHGRVGKKGYSYLYANVNNLPKNYSFVANVRNISGVDQQFVFRVSADKKEYYLVDFRYNDPGWYWDNNNIKVYRIYPTYYRTLGVYPSEFVPRTFDVIRNVDHQIRVVIKDNNIKAYFDNVLAVDVNDSEVALNGNGVGLMTWGGDLPYISENIFRNIEICDCSSNKIIVLPGLGASWNPQAIFLGNTSPSYQWSMTPFVKNYDLLVSAFEKNGLVKNQDFYVWNYDWRKPLSEIVNDFNIFVNGINLGVNQKVDLVGHSLGGLVARIWTQDHNDLVNKTITLGSPHYGAINAYEAWNGAKVGNNFDAASVALNVLLQLQKKNGDTSVQSLRNFAPIVFDLSPTFTFLKKNGSNLLNKYSQYLGQKNNSVSNSVSKLLTVDGYGENSKEWINLNDRSLFDKVLGIWEDGRPVSYLYGVGDGTVLKKSALISGSETNEFLSNHGDLVDKSVNWVIQKLGLGITVNIPSYPNNKKAIFYSNSNGVMKVNCNGKEQNENNGWIIFDNLDSNGCQINLVGDIDMGKYNLVVGDVNGWRYFLGDIGINEQVSLVVDSVDSYWLSLKNDFIELGVNSAMMAINQKNILKVIDEYIKFRQMTKNFKLSEEILNNIRLILDKKVVSNTEINTMYLKVLASKSLVETNLRLVSRNNIVPRYADALNYEQANILMEFGKNYAANYLANKLYGIVWK